MTEFPFHIVDVFARQRYTGNPLAVVSDAGSLSADTMQRIAGEMNYSETTFVTSTDPDDARYRVRIFTPATELPFAGHPTLGTAAVIREALSPTALEEIALDLDIGTIPISVESGEPGGDIYWMEQQSLSFGPYIPTEEAAGIVGLDNDRLDGSYAPQVVSTGLPTLIVPLDSLDAVRNAAIVENPYSGLVRAHDVPAVLVFTRETVDPRTDLHVRVFAPALDIPEDPATGSSNGCLAGYLSQHRYFGTTSVDIAVEQGQEIGRPSLLRLQADSVGDETAIAVGGRVIPIAEGLLR